MPRKQFIITIVLSVIMTMAAVHSASRAGTLNPASAPASTMKTLEDIYCHISGCTAGSYSIDSPGAVSATMHDLDDIYDALDTYRDQIDYSLEKNQIWDDNKGTSSSTANNLSYAYSNLIDQNFEEGTWTLYNDATLNGELVASNAVYKDERTGLYWADCYSSTSNAGSCSSRSNSFALNGTVDDADDGLDAEAGNSTNYCETLSLDSNGDGTDETDWYLPSQKELMQAYINGFANNVVRPDHAFWSSTEYHNDTDNAWYVRMSYGYTYHAAKSTISGVYTRCVRR